MRETVGTSSFISRPFSICCFYRTAAYLCRRPSLRGMVREWQRALVADPDLNDRFARLIAEPTTRTGEAARRFSALWPIFRVAELREQQNRPMGVGPARPRDDDARLSISTDSNGCSRTHEPRQTRNSRSDCSNRRSRSSPTRSSPPRTTRGPKASYAAVAPPRSSYSSQSAETSSGLASLVAHLSSPSVRSRSMA
jgi:hypothetical protein